jgi:hypothetical protein
MAHYFTTVQQAVIYIIICDIDLMINVAKGFSI